MEPKRGEFELEFKGNKILVQEYAIAAQIIFRVLFSDKRAPLVITRARHDNANHFWTSIPEGRQKEAEEVGALISQYFKSIP